MECNNSEIYHHLLSQQYWRMSELATTAERRSRTYTSRDGKTRIIKGKPAKKGLLPLGESTIWEKVRQGDFPTSIHLSSRITVWRSSDIVDWLESKV